jgi:hypothetical protein
MLPQQLIWMSRYGLLPAAGVRSRGPGAGSEARLFALGSKTRLVPIGPEAQLRVTRIAGFGLLTQVFTVDPPALAEAVKAVSRAVGPQAPAEVGAAGTASVDQTVHVGRTEGWMSDTWYVPRGTSGYVVAPDQRAPESGVAGVYVYYAHSGRWIGVEVG